MILKRLSSLLLLINVLSLSYSTELVRYKKYEAKDVNDTVGTLVLNEPFKVNEKTGFLSCGMKCNLQSPCQVFSLNESSYCTLYSDLTTVFDLKESTTSSVYAKYEIKACNDPDTYPDYHFMKCVPKHINLEVCNKTRPCLSSAGLECVNNECRCANPDEM